MIDYTTHTAVTYYLIPIYWKMTVTIEGHKKARPIHGGAHPLQRRNIAIRVSKIRVQGVEPLRYRASRQQSRAQGNGKKRVGKGFFHHDAVWVRWSIETLVLGASQAPGDKKGRLSASRDYPLQHTGQ